MLQYTRHCQWGFLFICVKQICIHLQEDIDLFCLVYYNNCHIDPTAQCYSTPGIANGVSYWSMWYRSLFICRNTWTSSAWCTTIIAILTHPVIVTVQKALPMGFLMDICDTDLYSFVETHRPLLFASTIPDKDFQKITVKNFIWNYKTLETCTFLPCFVL